MSNLQTYKMMLQNTASTAILVILQENLNAYRKENPVVDTAAGALIRKSLAEIKFFLETQEKLNSAETVEEASKICHFFLTD